MRADPITNADVTLACLTNEWQSVDALAATTGIPRAIVSVLLKEAWMAGRVQRQRAPSKRAKAYVYRRKVRTAGSGHRAGPLYHSGLIDW